MYLREYYAGQTFWLSTMRIVGGPVIVAIGIQFFQKSDRVAIAYGGFSFLYGIYYSIKPLLIIAIRPALFKSIIFNLSINAQELRLQEDGIESSIQFSSFNKISRYSSYYSLKLPNKMTIYLRAAQLTEAERTTLNVHLTT